MRQRGPVSTFPDERSLQLWFEQQGYARKVVVYNLRWIRRFCAYCARTGRVPEKLLTLADVRRFVRHYARRTGIEWWNALRDARRGLRGWRRFLDERGVPVPAWIHAAPPSRFDPLLDEYRAFCARSRPLTEGTLSQHLRYLRTFLSGLGRRPLRTVTPKTTDVFVAEVGRKVRPKTLSGICTALRSFFRFLHAAGHHPRDLAVHVVAPVARSSAPPPRALHPRDVRRLLGAVDRTTARGTRDYAILLLCAAYGMGAAEVCRLCLEDIDWDRGVIGLVRPKTGVATVLRLLPPVAHALVAYLRRARPTRSMAREIFVRSAPPYGRIRSPGSTVGAILQKHAAQAGLDRRYLGAHVLRHTHASRQVEAGVPPGS